MLQRVFCFGGKILFKLFQMHKRKLVVKAPITGTLINLEHVADPVFAQKLMGDGFAIEPQQSANTVYSPVTAKVVSLPDTKHAVGLVTNAGDEILLHIGIDTVNLKGKGFKSLVKLNDQVLQGQALIALNRGALTTAQVDLTTIIVLTKLIPNHQNWHFSKSFGTQVTEQDNVITQ